MIPVCDAIVRFVKSISGQQVCGFRCRPVHFSRSSASHWIHSNELNEIITCVTFCDEFPPARFLSPLAELDEPRATDLPHFMCFGEMSPGQVERVLTNALASQSS